MLDIVPRLRPPAPVPHRKSLGPIGLLKVLGDNPLEAWTEAHFEQPVVKNNFGLGTVAVVSDPTAIRRVLIDNAANYRKDNLQWRMLFALRGGLLTAEGEQWLVQRRALAPIFSSKSVREFAPAMARAAGDLVERWRCGPDVVDASVDLSGLALEVLERTIFSDGLGYDVDRMRETMRSYFDIVGRIDPFDVFGLPDCIPRLFRLRAQPLLRRFEHAVDAIIQARRRRLAAHPGDVPRDILTMLLQARDPESGGGLSEREVRANIVTFISAGHESTANAVTWTLFLLSQSPEWSARVAEEAERAHTADAAELTNKLVVTRAVVDEALRLYPPLAAISRVAIGPDALCGRGFKGGTLVVIAPYVVHRHRRLWDAPDYFDPTRFLPGRREVIDRYAYLPFGAGARGCIGSVFALQEAVLVVAAVMRNFELALPSDHDVWPVHRIMLRPRGGLPLRLSARGRTLPQSPAQPPASDIAAALASPVRHFRGERPAMRDDAR